MKIALGHKLKSGPWGGGNRFSAALAQALTSRGDQVVYGLNDPDIDLIVMVDPRARNPNVAFTPGQILRYRLRHPKTLVLHRINECDERKGTRTMNFRLRVANSLADHTVFIGHWLRTLEVWHRHSGHSVVLNGADARIFNRNGHVPWSKTGPIKLVTHHWGAHALKGFDVYERLDSLLDEPKWRGTFAFTYIGNIPKTVRFRNVRLVSPLDGEDLAQELKRHHAYITASINEPAGMHHIEGALCGLPLLYRNSGALPEYCDGFGEMFAGPHDVEESLLRLIDGYDRHLEALSDYRHSADDMCANYLALFEELMGQRDKLIQSRKPLRLLLYWLLTQLPL
ncbi:MAG: hypothetical protein HQL44_05130 [Alphaproteobacteria bacterium]|nr:hypothetical protein [Alphaproteobacteria bacterium]